MKNILLIGGSYGIGLAIAKELQFENNVYIASRSNENLAGLQVTHIPFDAATETLDISKLPSLFNKTSSSRATLYSPFPPESSKILRNSSSISRSGTRANRQPIDRRAIRHAKSRMKR